MSPATTRWQRVLPRGCGCGQRFNGTLPVMKAPVMLAVFLAATAFAQTSQKRSFTFEDMMALKRVGAPVPSPDGKWVVFDCEDVDLDSSLRCNGSRCRQRCCISRMKAIGC
jgi:hypothetical protein